MGDYDPTGDGLEDIEVTTVAVTQKAVCVNYNDDEQWLPRSQTDIDPRTPIGQGEVMTIGVKLWLLRKLGWSE